MTESQDMQKKPIVDFRKLLQERSDKVNPRRKLAKDKTAKLAKGNRMVTGSEGP